MPIVLPRDRPPLFSWEIYPGLYPIYIPPRPPRLHRRPATIYALFASLVICAGLVGAFGYVGVLAEQPATFTVSGTVVAPNGSPLAGAEVELTTEANQSSTFTTGLAGTFSFTNVPGGGILLNTTKTAYAYTAVYLFLSPVYVSGGSSTGLSLTLNPSPSNSTTIYVSPFPTLESLVAELWATAGLLALVAIVDAFAIVRTRRSSRPIFGVAAGFGSLLAPLPIALLSIEVAAPIPSLMTIPVAVLGGFAVGIGLVEMALAGQPSETV
ncbi:MAG: carboxypeptidase-like regulatory domain-containing protein [Thermoplasmata archaeon]